MKRSILLYIAVIIAGCQLFQAEAQISRLDKRFNVNRAKPTQQAVAKPTPKAPQRTIARTPSKKQSANRAVVKTSPTVSKSGVVSVIKPKSLPSLMEILKPNYKGSYAYSLEEGNKNEIKYRYKIENIPKRGNLLLVNDNIIVVNIERDSGDNTTTHGINDISFWDSRTARYISSFWEDKLGVDDVTDFRVMYNEEKKQFFMTGINMDSRKSDNQQYCYAYDFASKILERKLVRPEIYGAEKYENMWDFTINFQNKIFPNKFHFNEEMLYQYIGKSGSGRHKCAIAPFTDAHKIHSISQLSSYAFVIGDNHEINIVDRINFSDLSNKNVAAINDKEQVDESNSIDLSTIKGLPYKYEMTAESLGSGYWIIYPATYNLAYYALLDYQCDQLSKDQIYFYNSNKDRLSLVPLCVRQASGEHPTSHVTYTFGVSDCGKTTINACSANRWSTGHFGPRILSDSGTEEDLVFDNNNICTTEGYRWGREYDASKLMPVAYRIKTNSSNYAVGNAVGCGGEYASMDVASLFSIWNKIPDSSQKSYWIAGQARYCQLFLMDDENRTGKLIHQWSGLWSEDTIKPIWMPEKRWMCLPVVENQWDIYAVSEDFASVQKLYSVYTGAGDSYAVILPNGKYAGTPGCESFLYKEEGDVRIGMSALAPWRNRPGEVLEAIGGNRDDIQALKETTKRWLTKQGFDPENMPAEPKLSEFPVAEVTMPALFSESDTVKFSVKLKATAHGIKKVEVRADGILIPQSWDDALEIGEGEEKEVEVEVPLACGQNWIEVTPVDSEGISGDTFRFRTICKLAKPSDLYIVTIGVSDYDREELRLQYAAKDARDLAKAFEEYAKGDKHILTLTDKEVNDRGALDKVKEFLADAKVDDRVILYVAGHGMLDDKLNYYYAPAGFDSERIVETGIAMDELTACLHGAKAHRRLLLLDTCHSGVLGEEGEEKLAMAGVQLPHGVRAIQHRGMKAKKAEGALNVNAKKRYIEDMFSRGSTERGINIIAGAAGAEFALESDAWNNGVFTASIIQAIRGESAIDDREVSVAELQRRVQRSVYKYTAGKQKPSANASESADDYILADGVGGYNLKQIIENKEWNRIKEHLSRCPKIYAAGEAVEILELALKNHAPFDVIQQLFDHGWSLNNKYSLSLFLGSDDFYDNCKKDMVKMFLNKGSKLGEYDEYDGDDAEFVAFLFEHGLKRYKKAFFHTRSKELFRLSVKYGMNANGSMYLSDEIDIYTVINYKNDFLHGIHRQRIERKYRNDRYSLEREMSSLYSDKRESGYITPLWNLALQYVLNKRKEEAQREILEKMEILLEYGADPNISEEGSDGGNAAETTPLYLLCRHSDITFKEALPAIKLLLKYGASIHRTDCNGKEPLDEDDPYYRVLEKMAEAARAGKSLDEF